MDYPKELRYSKNHEWLKAEGDELIVGITGYAQDALGDIVFIELPKQGDKVKKGKGIAVVESVKSVSDVYAPLSGEITQVNQELEDKPEQVNESPYDKGWMFRIRPEDSSQVEDLMDATEYAEHVAK
ncbi:glycine cleavage system protein GcvH [Candidatus Altiarchaeota archaeon]